MGRKPDYDERFDRLVRGLGFAVMHLQKANEKEGEDGVRVTDLRFKLDADNRTSVLVVVKGVREGEPVVAFTGGPDLETAVLALGARVKGNTMRWRVDEPWGGQSRARPAGGEPGSAPSVAGGV